MKRALSVGINYTGSSHALNGCINDSHVIEAMLRERHGFTDITVVLDLDATAERIRSELQKLVAGATPGDVIFFHYSGHGSQIVDDNGDEADGLDEVICPVDFDWAGKMIRDDELKALFDRVPDGVNLTVLLDCCNSGTGLDQNNEYDPLALPKGATGDVIPRSVRSRDGSRYLPPPPEMMEKIKAIKVAPHTRSLTRQVNNSALLISGCRSNQTSADAHIGGVYQGACTYFFDKNSKALGPTVTYKQLVDSMNRDLAGTGFSQRPQLDGPANLFDRVLLAPFDFGTAGAVTAPPPAPVVPAKPSKPTANVPAAPSVTTPAKDDKKDGKSNILYIVGGIILAAIVFYISMGH